MSKKSANQLLKVSGSCHHFGSNFRHNLEDFKTDFKKHHASFKNFTKKTYQENVGSYGSDSHIQFVYDIFSALIGFYKIVENENEKDKRLHEDILGSFMKYLKLSLSPASFVLFLHALHCDKKDFLINHYKKMIKIINDISKEEEQELEEYVEFMISTFHDAVMAQNANEVMESALKDVTSE